MIRSFFKFISTVALPLIMTIQTTVADGQTTVADIRKVWADREISVAVKGNQAGIVEFAKAFVQTYNTNITEVVLRQLQTPDRPLQDDDVASFILDRANGYMECRFVSDGDVWMEMCFWKTPDNHRLVAVSMLNVYEDKQPLLMFYDFSFDTKTMSPVNPAPIEGHLNMSNFTAHLPQKGKDIQLYPHEDGISPGTLHWNGKGFTFGKAHAENGKDETCLSVFISDNTDTNIRNSPNGKVVKQLSGNGDYMLCVFRSKNGWWQIKDNEIEAYTDSFEGTITVEGTDKCWINYSVLGVSTRNYASQKLTLRATPSETATTVYSFSEGLTLRPLECRGEWVKVKTTDGKHSGWIQSEWLCGNPLTTCP